MASVNTVATLDGLYKSVYGDKGPINLLPDCAILQELVPFESAERTGKSFNVPVVVSAEQGFSFGLADETITLNTEVAATLKNLEVKALKSLDKLQSTMMLLLVQWVQNKPLCQVLDL